MPELPEVETIARGLRQTIVGKKISQVKAIFPGVVKQDCSLFAETIKHREVEGVRRRGKYLLIDLSGGKMLLIHLGMTGNLLFTRSAGCRGKESSRRRSRRKSPDKHDHLIFEFCDTDLVLRYNDQRKFGKLKACESYREREVSELKKLGPESVDVSSSDFVEIFRKRNGRIKPALLNQSIIAGLGNIYADESLFEARIHPARKVDSLSERKLRDLHKGIRKVLKRAIKAGGSSVDNYLNVDGQMGRFQLQHKVYGREGERCRRCGGKIKRIKIDQRSSYFCPRCQPFRKA